MSLKDKIDADIKQSMKARDALRLGCLRLVISAIKNKELEKRAELTDPEIFSILSMIAKQRGESIEMFNKGGRKDLADKESAELKIIQSYMPKQLSEDEVKSIVDAAIAEAGAKAPGDMGKVMKIVVPKVQGQADGKLVSEIVKNRLKNSP